MTAGLHLQQMGRALRPGWRIIHAARARKLRRRGEDVSYYGRTSTGKARYAWMPRRGAPQVLDHVPTTNQGPQ